MLTQCKRVAFPAFERSLHQGKAIRFILFLVLYFYTYPQFIFSQQPTFHEKWRWVHFTTEDGLPSNQVSNIVELSNGIVWAQTNSGIAYYDGFHWNAIDKSLGLHSKSISTMCVNPVGDVVVITHSYEMFAGNQFGFRKINLYHDQEKITAAKIAYSTNRRFIIIGLNYQVYLTDSTLTTCTPYSGFGPNTHATKLWNTENRKTWIQTNDGLFSIENDHPVLKLASPSPALPIMVEYICEDNVAGGYAMLSYPRDYHGIWHWTKDSPPARTGEGARHFIRSLAVKDTFPVIYSYLFGEVRIKKNTTWQELAMMPSEFNNLLFLKYRTNGDLWAGTESGLNLFRSTLSLWTYHSFPPPHKSNIVGELVLTRDNDLWAATDSGILIYKKDGSSTRIDAVLGQQLIAITGLAEDRDGRIWISSGLSFKGTYCWNGINWKYFGEKEGLYANFHRIKKDLRGDLWFLGLAEVYNDSSMEPGAFQYRDGKFKRWGPREGLIHGRVYAFAQGNDSAYWFGTNGGLARWKDGVWSNWTTRNGLASDRVFTLDIDSANTVWFSDQNTGIGSLRDDFITYHTADDGLIDNTIWEIKTGINGDIWVTTSAGLALYRNGVWSHIDENIGLSPLRLWPIFPTKEQLYIGTLGGGVAILNLQQVPASPPAVFYGPMAREKNSAYLRWQPYSYWGGLLSDEIQTRYKLDDGSWSSWGTNGEKLFLDLSPGSHIFTVQAMGALGNFAPMGYSTSFFVEFPYYLQPRFLVTTLILSGGLFVLSFIIVYKKRRHAQDIALREAQFRGIIRDQTDLICRYTPEGKLIFVNDAFCRYFSASATEITGHVLFEIIPLNSRHSFREHFKAIQTLTTSNPVLLYTQEIIWDTGEIQWQEWSDRGFFNNEGTLIEIQSVGRDITGQKRMEDALRQSEQEYRGLFEHAHDAIILFEPETEIIIEANQHACELYGFSKDELIGISIENISENVPLGKERIRETFAKGYLHQFETVQYRKDGSRLYLDINASIVNYQGCEVIMCINHDITSRKLYELDIKKREAILETLSFTGQQFNEPGSPEQKIQNVLIRFGETLQVSRVSIFENHTDEHGEIVATHTYEWSGEGITSYINDQNWKNVAYRRKGLSRWIEFLSDGEPILGKVPELPNEERVFLTFKNVQSVIIMPIQVNGVWWGIIKFDDCVQQRVWTQSEIEAIRTTANILGAVIERTQRETTVTMLAHAIKSISEGISITDSQNILLFVNDAFCRMYGYSQEEVLGKHISILVPSLYRTHEPDILTHTIDGGWHGELINRRKDNSEFPVFLSTSPVKDENNTVVALIGIAIDITERKQVEKQLKEQASLLNITTDAVIVEDMNHTIVYWNSGAQHLYGWSTSEALGNNLLELLSVHNVELATQISQALLTAGAWRGEITQYSKDKRTITVDSRYVLVYDEAAQPVSILVVNTDISEKKMLEEQILRSQRLESIGTLAGGIAHDLNNVLAPILLSVDMLKHKFTDQASQTILSTLESSASRGKDIIRQVLTFARGIAGERVVLHLGNILKEIEYIMKETFPKSLRISLSISSELWTTLGDYTQIHQILLNLCVNARDAMPNGGTLVLHAENRIIDDTYCRTHLNASAGAYICISVSDTGVGIPQENLSKIFDPFFTTKEIGKGTGLGLSTVHAIVKGHKGFIEVVSKEGSGSTFAVFLPASRQTQEALTKETFQGTLSGNNELIMVVDDEDAILDISSKMLVQSHYTVLTATDGADAVAKFIQHQSEISLVLTDIMMPYMDGVSLIRSLRKIKPDLRIIASSGQLTDSQFLNAAGLSVNSFLAKPFTAESLLKTIHEVLNGDANNNSL